MDNRILIPVVMLFLVQPHHREGGREENPHTHQENFVQEFAVGRATIVAVTSATDVVATTRETVGAQDRASYELIQK